MRSRLWVFGTVIVLLAAALFVLRHHHRWIARVETAMSSMLHARGLGASVERPNHPLTIMAVGGSSAQGYDDPDLDGYLARALGTVSSTLNVPIRFVNKARSGDIPTMFAPQFDPLVHTVHPNAVIISWGLLNSIARNVPQDMFRRVIQSEVSMALHEGADVWIVTPPATLASYVGPEVELETEYASIEVSAAQSVQSSQVHVFDLLTSMKKYLADHHESYKPYVANEWHLNRAGHVLAGQILANDILQQARATNLLP